MRQSSQGFSLIELLIVTAILGILAAVAIPSYRRYIAVAEQASVRAYLADIQKSYTSCIAIESYTACATQNISNMLKSSGGGLVHSAGSNKACWQVEAGDIQGCVQYSNSGSRFPSDTPSAGPVVSHLAGTPCGNIAASGAECSGGVAADSSPSIPIAAVPGSISMAGDCPKGCLWDATTATCPAKAGTQAPALAAGSCGSTGNSESITMVACSGGECMLSN